MSTITITEKLIAPENALERRIIKDPMWQKGAFWGKPRRGHPEGEVIYHIREVLDNVDKYATDIESRRKLRLVTIVHDTFKYAEDRSTPRNWDKHHAVLAGQFLEQYTDEEDILKLTYHHDDAYYAWCAKNYKKSTTLSDKLLHRLFNNVGDFLPLYFTFFKCDTQTGDKIQKPVKWFENKLDAILSSQAYA